MSNGRRADATRMVIFQVAISETALIIAITINLLAIRDVRSPVIPSRHVDANCGHPKQEVAKWRACRQLTKTCYGPTMADEPTANLSMLSTGKALYLFLLMAF
jgi:hypothetical protein